MRAAGGVPSVRSSLAALERLAFHHLIEDRSEWILSQDADVKRRIGVRRSPLSAIR